MGLLLSKPMMYAAMLTVALVALAVVARNWSCRQGRERDPIDRTLGPCQVISVDSGSTLTVAGRLRGDEPESRRESSLSLPGVASPAEGQPGFEESKTSLTASTGNEVMIDRQKEKILDRFEIVAVYSATGQDLSLSQLQAGMAWCQIDAGQTYRDAQKAAQKRKVGLWAGRDYDMYRLGESQ